MHVQPALLASLLLAGPSGLGAQQSTDAPTDPWAETVDRDPALLATPTRGKGGWWTSAAGLTYRAYYPKPGKQRSGLVLLLHGSNGWYQGVEGTFRQPLLKAGFVVVIPRSTRFEDPSAPNKKWVETDYPKLESLTRQIAHSGFVDRTRIYMLGFSNGNRGGNVVFTRPELYAGFVSIGGGPWMIGRPRALTETQQQDMGIYFLIGSKDPYKNETDRAHGFAKAAGLKDIVYKEYPGLGHTIPPGCSGEVMAWLLRNRRSFMTGECPDLKWTETAPTSATWTLIYFYSKEKRHHTACRSIEWDWLIDGWMRALAGGMCCMRVDLASKDPLMERHRVQAPTVLIVSPEGKVKLRVAGSTLARRGRASRRGKDVEKSYLRFRASLASRVRKAIRSR